MDGAQERIDAAKLARARRAQLAADARQAELAAMAAKTFIDYPISARAKESDKLASDMVGRSVAKDGGFIGEQTALAMAEAAKIKDTGERWAFEALAVERAKEFVALAASKAAEGRHEHGTPEHRADAARIRDMLSRAVELRVQQAIEAKKLEDFLWLTDFCDREHAAEKFGQMLEGAKWANAGQSRVGEPAADGDRLAIEIAARESAARARGLAEAAAERKAAAERGIRESKPWDLPPGKLDAAANDPAALARLMAEQRLLLVQRNRLLWADSQAAATEAERERIAQAAAEATSEHNRGLRDALGKMAGGDAKLRADLMSAAKGFLADFDAAKRADDRAVAEAAAAGKIREAYGRASARTQGGPALVAPDAPSAAAPAASPPARSEAPPAAKAPPAAAPAPQQAAEAKPHGKLDDAVRFFRELTDALANEAVDRYRAVADRFARGAPADKDQALIEAAAERQRNIEMARLVSRIAAQREIERASMSRIDAQPWTKAPDSKIEADRAAAALAEEPPEWLKISENPAEAAMSAAEDRAMVDAAAERLGVEKERPCGRWISPEAIAAQREHRGRQQAEAAAEKAAAGDAETQKGSDAIGMGMHGG